MLAQLAPHNKRGGTDDLQLEEQRQEKLKSEENVLLGTDEKRKQAGKGMHLHDLVYSNYKQPQSKQPHDLTEIKEIRETGPDEPEVSYFEENKRLKPS